MSVGPYSVDVVEPLKVLRVKLDENEHGIKADVTFTARTKPIKGGFLIFVVSIASSDCLERVNRTQVHSARWTAYSNGCHPLDSKWIMVRLD